MKKNLLILVHVEDIYRQFFRPMYIQSIIKSCKAKKYDRVIHLTSYIDNDSPIKEIETLVENIHWSYGYEPNCFYDDIDNQFIIPSDSCHEWTWIPNEFRNGFFKNYNVYIGGGYEGECLLDFESLLDYLKVKYKKIEGLVYGN